MTKHKITAIKMEQKGDVVTITGITQSPRGTKALAGTIRTPVSKTSRTDRRNSIARALEELLGSDE